MAAELILESISAFASGTGGTATVNAPTGLDEGDLIKVDLGSEGGGMLTGLPSGFVAFLELDDSGSMIGAIAFKVATSSEPSTYDFTYASGTTSWGAQSSIVRGADTTDFPDSALVDSDKTANESNSTSVIVPEITVGIGDLVFGLVSSRGTGATITSNASKMTPMASTQSHGSRTMRSFYQSIAASGASGTYQFNVDQGTYHTAGIVAIKAGPSAPTAPVLTATPTSWDAVRLQVESDAPEVNIYRSTTSPVSDLDTLVATLDPTEETMAFDTDLDPDTEYFYLAVASNEIGDTDSEEDSATTYEDDAISTFTTNDPIDFPLTVSDGQQANSVQLRLGKIIRGMSGLDRAVSFDIVVSDESYDVIGTGTATNVPATENGSVYSVLLDPPAIGPQELTVTITPTIEEPE